jgi:hypothetical protein
LEQNALVWVVFNLKMKNTKKGMCGGCQPTGPDQAPARTLFCAVFFCQNMPFSTLKNIRLVEAFPAQQNAACPEKPTFADRPQLDTNSIESLHSYLL